MPLLVETQGWRKEVLLTMNVFEGPGSEEWGADLPQIQVAVKIKWCSLHFDQVMF